MEKYISIFTMAIAAVMIGCNKVETLSTDTEMEGEECLVTFNPIGEITTSESPLSKGATMTDDIYCVQAYKGTEYFAFGYFDNLESMKLYLKQGSSYRIVVCMVKDAKNILGERFNLTQNSIRNTCSDVFDFQFLSTYYSSSSGMSLSYNYYYPSTWYYPVNYYQYAFKEEVKKYDSSTSSSLSNIPSVSKSYLHLQNISNGILNGVQYPSCTDWFYGEVNDYTPTGDYETLDMTFKRVGFKLKYELSGVTDGEVTVTVSNSTRTFIEKTTNTSTYSSDTQFIAFYDTKSAWQYADDYSENMDVHVVWKRGIGVTQDLGTKTIQVKRNCLNNIKIALGSDDRNGGVNMSLESESSMGNLVTDIPVQ